MAKQRSPNPNVQEYQLNMDAEIAARQQLEDAGVYKPEDLTSGRADIGRAAEVFTNAGIDEELAPLLAEKAIRDAQFAEQAGGDEQPEPAQSPEAAPPQDRLSKMQADLEAAKAEAERFKTLYGRGENDKGNLRRRMREIEERLEGRSQQPTYQPPMGYNPAMTGYADPAAPVTAGDMQQALSAFAVAMGNVVRQTREEVIREARNLSKYDLTVDEEEDLLDGNPWLKSLPSGQREQAMMSLARPANGSARPAATRPTANLTPRPTTPEDALRARVRQTAFIEAPSGASLPERMAASATDMLTAQKLQKLKAALAKPGGSEEAGSILASLGAGPTDDRDRGFPRR